MEGMEFELKGLTTISEWVNKGRLLDFSNERISYKESFDDMIMNVSSLLSNHYYAFTSYIVDFEFTEDEYIKYKYSPKMLSLDLYNTTELWSAILFINNMTSISQFKKKKIKLFTPDIIEIFREAMDLYKDDLAKNKNRIDEYENEGE